MALCPPRQRRGGGDLKGGVQGGERPRRKSRTAPILHFSGSNADLANLY